MFLVSDTVLLISTNIKSPGEQLRDLIDGDQSIIVPGVSSSIVAMMAQQIGFSSLYVSGAATSNNLGLPDVGLITMSEVIDLSTSIINSVSVPLIIDVDTGFGDVLNVSRTVKSFEQIGVAGIQLEDQVLPKKCGHLDGKQLVSPEEMAAKIIMATKSKTNPNFFIIARTDARGVNGFDDSLSRAKLYLESGADMIFPEALENESEFIEFAKKIDAPLLANMTEFGKSPYLSVEQFQNMGYSIILFPVTVLRSMLKAADSSLRELKLKGTQVGLLDKMLKRSEIYEIINYREFINIE